MFFSPFSFIILLGIRGEYSYLSFSLMCFPPSPPSTVPGGHHTNSLMSMLSVQRSENVEERCGERRGWMEVGGRDDRWGLHVMVSW